MSATIVDVSLIEGLRRVPDDELLRRLSQVMAASRRTDADLVAHIGEVDERRLYAREGAASMFIYCTTILRLSGSEAYLRIGVARVVRRHPVLFDMLTDGRLRLSAIAKLAPLLTEENRDRLLARAVHLTTRQLDELIAEVAPRPDARTVIRRLPESAGGVAHAGKLRADGVVADVPGRRGIVRPLAPARYLVQFTASARLKEKLERLAALMRSSVPDGDLAKVVELAVTEKLERLESQRFGLSRAPRKATQSKRDGASRRATAAARRDAFTRAGGRCEFVSPGGKRCEARAALEFDHVKPWGRGGKSLPGNLRLLCRTHNQHMAEREYGKAWMDRFRREAPSAEKRSRSIRAAATLDTPSTGSA